jgi:gliding motility-associated-like protein
VLSKTIHIRIALFCLIGLIASLTSSAQSTIGPPRIQCIAVDSTGASATVTWAIPSDTNNTFISYEINSSTTGAGYTVGPPVAPDNVSSTVVTGINANASLIYFFGKTTTTQGDSTGDTVKSIYLSVTNSGTGVAILQWNAMHAPALAGFNGWYKIYREYPQYVWKLLDSTKALTYNDTITICSATLEYKIVTDNFVAGCQSVSNIAGGPFKNITVPNSPVMDTVSVTPGNNVEISWYPSTSSDVVGYYVYEWLNNSWQIIDTVKGINSTYFNYIGSTPNNGSEKFCVAAFDSCTNLSPLSPPQNTIFLQNFPDKCAQTDSLSWNAFIDLLGSIGKYNVYESVNGKPFTLLGSTNNTGYTQTGLNKIETLCYYIQVVDKSNPSITAASNIICYQTTLPPPPKFSYLQSATVINNYGTCTATQNQVNWYVDTGAGIETFEIYRADSAKGANASVGTVNAASGKVFYSFVDPTANPNMESYVYKVYSKDSCNFITDSTNIGQTIFLTAVGNSTGQNVINWNGYANWQQGVANYTIYRNEDCGAFTAINTFTGSLAGPYSYTDDVSAIITGQGVFGYYIKAIENPSTSPAYPFVDTSISNIALAYQDPRLYIPNAFNPNGINKIFMPVGVFENIQNYDFTIYDRWGQMIFETTDDTQGWNGTYDGHKVEEGVYIYRIQYTSSKGEYFNQRGWVMMLK